ncbi:MAG: BON domain-containing protein [Dokdonella sp.]
MKRSQQKIFGIAVLMAFAIGAHAADPPTTSAADNTRVNKRDTDHAMATPTDQPNNSADVKFAADVRSAIYKDKTLSTKAHNVKLVAADGVVTLRGPVASADEKAKVEAIVGSVAGVKRVDNQLDVAD